MFSLQNSQKQIYQFLNQPKDGWSMRYFSINLIATIIAITVVFVEIFFPGTFLLGSLELWLAECFFLVIFGPDLILRLYCFSQTPKKERTGDMLLIALDILVVGIALLVVLKGLGVQTVNPELWTVLGFIRLFRITKLIRKAKLSEKAFGKTVLSKVASDIILFICIQACLALLLQSFPQLKAILGLDLLNAGASFLLVVLGIIAAAALGLTYAKSYELNKLSARLISSIRALADDLAEFQTPQNKMAVDPTVAEKHLQNFFEAKIDQAQLYKKIDQWCTELFRAYRDDSQLKDSMAGLAAISARADTLCATAAEVTAIASHHHAVALYDFMNRLSYTILLLLAIPMAESFGGILITAASVFAIRGSLSMLEDSDFSLDKVLNVFNTPMPKFPEWPSRN